MTHLFQLGPVTLHSGRQSMFKIDCDALTAEDWEALAAAFHAGFGGAWGEAVGVPRGGLALAAHLNVYSMPREEAYRRELFSYYDVLVVDDVATTGTSIRGLARAFLNQGKDVHCVVAFSRMDELAMAGPISISAMFKMSGWMNHLPVE